jgi:hypothetical protein
MIYAEGDESGLEADAAKRAKRLDQAQEDNGFYKENFPKDRDVLSAIVQGTFFGIRPIPIPIGPKKSGKPRMGNGRGKYWKDVATGEIKMFVGLLIYMGLYHRASVAEYWDKSGKGPIDT